MGLWDEVEDLDIDIEESPNKYLSNKEYLLLIMKITT